MWWALKCTTEPREEGKETLYEEPTLFSNKLNGPMFMMMIMGNTMYKSNGTARQEGILQGYGEKDCQPSEA